MKFLLYVSSRLLTTIRMYYGNVCDSAGMQDACVASCLERISRDSADKSSSGTAQQLYATPAAAQDSASTAASSPAPLPTWSMHSADPFSQCMQRYCAATEPTKYNPEVRNFAHCSDYFSAKNNNEVLICYVVWDLAAVAPGE
jgi:hypothetical protein